MDELPSANRALVLSGPPSSSLDGRRTLVDREGADTTDTALFSLNEDTKEALWFLVPTPAVREVSGELVTTLLDLFSFSFLSLTLIEQTLESQTLNEQSQSQTTIRTHNNIPNLTPIFFSFFMH
jgi:hypothetical protein